MIKKNLLVHIHRDRDALIHAMGMIVTLISIFYYQGYMERENMINNGFISDESIAFTIETFSYPLIPGSDSFILMQYDDATPAIKYVYEQGNINLPPYDVLLDEKLEDKPYIIIGSSMYGHYESEYPITGIFNAPKSYIFPHEIWIMSDLINFDENRGNQYIFLSKSLDNSQAFERFINGNSIIKIDVEYRGSYQLQSNRGIKTLLHITLALVIVLTVMITQAYIVRQSQTMQVLYYSGYSPTEIILIFCKRKLAIVFPVLLMIFSFIYIFERYNRFTWNDRWAIQFLMVICLWCFVFLLQISWVVYKNTIIKGGKRF